MHQSLGVLFIVSAALAHAAEPPLLVHLRTSLPSPQPVGTPIGLFPEAENVGAGTHVMRYSVSVNGGPFRVISDFSQQPIFAWAPELFEQNATLRVDVRNNETKAAARDELPFRIVSRVKGTSPLVTPTAHPLVALFSSPPCPQGSQFRVAFSAAGEQGLSRTPAQPCRGSISNNVYVAGMRPETEYRMRSELISGTTVKAGDWLSFRSGIVDGAFNPVSIVVPRANGAATSEPVIIHSAESLAGGIRPFATDLQGRLIWYLRVSDGITRVLPGGRFLSQGDGSNSVNSTREEQMLREYDLAGNILHETNAGAVGEQLAAHGIHSDCRAGGKECLSGFHHEAIRLPNGHTLAIAGLERMMPAGTQGSDGPVDVVGDVVVDLDEDFQVAGLWNEFDHLDLKRKSVFGATCRTGQGGCPPILLAPKANGWTHSNSLQYIPSTGDFLVSIPEQDWVVKVDWKNGKGTGNILWRLGRGGDFKLEGANEDAWFSYAHDVGYEPVGSDTLTVADDANIQFKKDQKTGTRAQVWKLDETNHVAKLVYNVDLGTHSRCCGSMQMLKSGGYSTVSGWAPTLHGRTVETDKNGNILYAIDVQGAMVYRSFRVDDMYSAPSK